MALLRNPSFEDGIGPWQPENLPSAVALHTHLESASWPLGLDGFQVLAAEVGGGEWQLAVQTTATVVGCIGPWRG